MSNLNNGGLTRVLNYIKTWVNGLLSGKSDTSHTHTKSQITDFPTIPTVNNATLTIKKNGTNVATFTSNASSNVTANITVPTNTNQLTNGSGFITSAVKESSIGNTSGWCLLHGGLLIQWGTEVAAGDVIINFYKAFSVVPIVVANYGDNVAFSTPCTVDDVSKTAFIAIHYASTESWRVNWIAIGRA